jgi:hypothetical protein
MVQTADNRSGHNALLHWQPVLIGLVVALVIFVLPREYPVPVTYGVGLGSGIRTGVLMTCNPIWLTL